MKTPVHTASLRRTAGRIISTLLLLCTACTGKETAGDDTFENPVVLKYENTSIYFHEGTYYYVTNSNGNLELYAVRTRRGWNRAPPAPYAASGRNTGCSISGTPRS